MLLKQLSLELFTVEATDIEEAETVTNHEYLTPVQTIEGSTSNDFLACPPLSILRTIQIIILNRMERLWLERLV